MARETGRDRSQLTRILSVLTAERFVVKDEAYRTFDLDPRLYADAHALTLRRLMTDGATALEQAVARTGESCYLGVLRGDTTVTIAEQVPASSTQIGSWVGRAYPAYCSDCGQALLVDADADEVRAVLARTTFEKQARNTPTDVDDFLLRLAATRERGYSIVDEEAEPGLFSLAVPIRDYRNEVVAALQVVGPRTRIQPKLDECAQAALDWGRWLEASLRGDHGVDR